MPPNPDDGGMPYIIHNLASEQAKKGHDVTVLSSEGVPYKPKCNYKVHQIVADENNSILREIPADTEIVHLHETREEDHALFQQDSFRTVCSIYGNRTESRSVPPNAIFTSRSHARNHNSHCYVYNGVCPETYLFNSKPDNNLMFIGKVRRSKKGAAKAISVAKACRTRLILAGGKKLKIIDSWLPISRYISTVGVIDGKKKVDYLRNSKALLFPIQWEEPFGMVQIEAMACGTPVISFNRGAAKEVISHGKNGFIVETEDEMIEAVKNIKKIQRKNCRDHVLENFTITKTESDICSLYKRVKEGSVW